MGVSLHWYHDRDGGRFLCQHMAPRNTPSGAPTIAPQKIQREPQGLSLGPGIWAAQLQRGAIFANLN